MDRAEGKTDQAMAAWEETLQHVREFYPGTSPDRSQLTPWHDPVAERACKIVGGLANLKAATIDAMPANRARFIEAYNEIKKREKSEQRELPQIAAARAILAELAEQKRLPSGAATDADV
jgi:hypothetical protein